MKKSTSQGKTKSELIVELEISQAWIASLQEAEANHWAERSRLERYLAVQYGVAQVFLQPLSSTQAIKEILQVICETVCWNFGAFWKVEDQELVLRCLATWHSKAELANLKQFNEASEQLIFTLGSDLPGQVWEVSHPIWIQDISTDSHLPRSSFAAREGLRTAFGFPLLFEGQVLGVMEFFIRDSLEPDEKLIAVLEGVGSRLGQFLERKQAESDLKGSTEQFHQFLENIPEVYWMSNLDKTQIIYISPSYEKVWGRTCASLYQQPTSLIEAIHIEDRERVKAALEKQAKGNYAEIYRVVRPDGTFSWIRERVFPIRNEEGEVYRLTGLATDITYRFREEEEIYKALVEAKELSELKFHLVAMTSHEFRTPLSGILSSAELLEHYSQGWPEEKKVQALQRIQSLAKNMAKMLEDVLLVGRAEAGRLELQPKHLNLTKLCRELVEEIQPIAGKKKLIHFVSPVPEICGWLDENLLRHILLNLLSNALKYSEGSKKIHFELTGPKDQGVVILEIKDQGIGIPLQDQARLFEPFFRASNVGRVAGTGLGLVIVKRAVDLHRGQLAVASQPGKGTTFRVTLPLTSSPAPEKIL